MEFIEFSGYYKNRKTIWYFQSSDQEKIMEFPAVLVLGLKISEEGCKTQLVEFLGGWTFVLSVISMDEIKNLKIPQGFSKKYILNPPCFSFFWNSSLKTLFMDSEAMPVHNQPEGKGLLKK